MKLFGLTVLDKKNVIWTTIILLLVFVIVFLSARYFLQVQETKRLQEELSIKQTNDKVISFLKLFVQKVLKSGDEVSFEDRVRLENVVKELDDQEILFNWERFTKSTSEVQIQQRVKDLMETLVKKIYY